MVLLMVVIALIFTVDNDAYGTDMVSMVFGVTQSHPGYLYFVLFFLNAYLLWTSKPLGYHCKIFP